MKTLRLFSILVLTGIMSKLSYSHAQTIYFGYDAAGNRISRSITLQKSTSQHENENQFEPQEFKDQLGNHDILIYPNPVTSELIVKIPSLSDNEYATISLFDQSGRMVYRNDRATGHNTISFSGMNAGVYYMKIMMKENSVEWKVVKE